MYWEFVDVENKTAQILLAQGSSVSTQVQNEHHCFICFMASLDPGSKLLHIHQSNVESTAIPEVENIKRK